MRTIDRRCNDYMCEDKGTYGVQQRCYNCGQTSIAVMTKGHEFWSGIDCPYCGLSHRWIAVPDSFTENPEVAESES